MGTKKAVFFDIDGTLVNFRGQMPQSAKKALLELQRNGHKIILCSGRSRRQMYPFLLELGFDGIVGATGAYVECGNDVVFRHSMSSEEIHIVTGVLDKAGACYSAQAGECMITSAQHRDRQLARFHALLDDAEMIEQIWRHVKITDHMEQMEGIEKFVYYESAWPVQKIREHLPDRFDVTESSFEAAVDDSGEVTSHGINKAYGMQKYLERAGIAREDTIAFGDGPNDFDMLEYAAVGVAMGNAVAALKDRADYIAAGVDEDGVARALQDLGLVQG